MNIDEKDLAPTTEHEEIPCEAVSDAKKVKKKSKFKKALLIYTGVLALICVALLCMGWELLSQYEDSQPKYVMEAVCEDFTPYLEAALADKYKNTVTEYENWDAVFRDVLAPAFEGEYTYRRAVREYTALNPVYTVSCGSDIANITLSKSGETSSFGFAVWEVSAVDIIADLSGVSTVTTVIEARSRRRAASRRYRKRDRKIRGRR